MSLMIVSFELASSRAFGQSLEATDEDGVGRHRALLYPVVDDPQFAGCQQRATARHAKVDVFNVITGDPQIEPAVKRCAWNDPLAGGLGHAALGVGAEKFGVGRRALVERQVSRRTVTTGALQEIIFENRQDVPLEAHIRNWRHMRDVCTVQGLREKCWRHHRKGERTGHSPKEPDQTEKPAG